MKKFILIIIPLLAIELAYSQVDSLENKIPSVKDYEFRTISLTRKLIPETIKQKDFEKLHKISKYIKAKSTADSNVYLFIHEEILLDYWLLNYSNITKNIEDFYSCTYFYKSKVHPTNYIFMYEKLVDLAFEQRDELMLKLFQSPLDLEDKEFLKVFFFYLIRYSSSYVKQDTVNILSEHFFSEFPESKFFKFISNAIYFKYKTTNFGFGYNASSGFNAFTKSLGNYFTNVVPLAGGFDFSYKNIYLYLQCMIGSSKVKQDFTYNQIWNKGLKLDFFLPEVSIGYNIYESERIKAIPFYGISWIILSEKKDYDENDVDFKFPSTPCQIFGLNLEYKFSRDQKFEEKNSGEFLFLQFRFGYAVPYKPAVNEIFDGHPLYFNIGIGSFLNPEIRVKPKNRHIH